jgi:hypothetical protein
VRRTAAAVVAAVLCGGLGACSSGTPGDISPAAARALRAQVEHVREVAAGGDYQQLKAAVAALKGQVEQFRRDGDVSSSRAVAIDDAADVLLEDTSPSPTPSPTTTSPTPSQTTTPPPTTTTPPPTTTSPPVVVTTTTTTAATSSSPPGNGNGNGNGGNVSIGPVGH